MKTSAQNRSHPRVVGADRSRGAAGRHRGLRVDPAHTHGFTFTNQLDSRQSRPGEPRYPTVGDASYIASHVVEGRRGGPPRPARLVSLTGGGVRLCEVDFLLSHGTITTRGITYLASQDVTLVVTGGTGHYFGARGAGALTSTPTGSVVQLRLG